VWIARECGRVPPELVECAGGDDGHFDGWRSSRYRVVDARGMVTVNIGSGVFSLLCCGAGFGSTTEMWGQVWFGREVGRSSGRVLRMLLSDLKLMVSKGPVDSDNNLRRGYVVEYVVFRRFKLQRE
jgi:hypothetical protein